MPDFHEVFSVMDQARNLGYRRLDNGTELIGHVPHVAPLAWLHVRFAPLMASDIEQLEEQLQRPIPESYREFLVIANGLHLFVTTFTLDGMRVDYDRSAGAIPQPFSLDIPNLFERPRDAKPEFFFIGGYDHDGSLLYLDKGAVVRCARRSATPLNRWPSFEQMLVSETKRVASLFDEKGRARNPDAPTVPLTH